MARGAVRSAALFSGLMRVGKRGGARSGAVSGAVQWIDEGGGKRGGARSGAVSGAVQWIDEGRKEGRREERCSQRRCSVD